MRPDVLAHAGVGRVELALGRGLILIGLHVVDVLREHDARVVHVLAPVAHPLQRHEALVVDGAQREHHVGDGQVALAHHAVGEHAVAVDGVLDVHMLDVVAQVGQRLLGGLAHEAIRMVQIPQRADAVRGKVGQQVAQARGVGVHAVGLHQQHHAARFRLGDQRAQLLLDQLVVHLARRRSAHVAHDADKRRVQLLRQVDIVRQLRDIAVTILRNGKRAAAG